MPVPLTRHEKENIFLEVRSCYSLVCVVCLHQTKNKSYTSFILRLCLNVYKNDDLFLATGIKIVFDVWCCFEKKKRAWIWENNNEEIDKHGKLLQNLWVYWRLLFLRMKIRGSMSHEGYLRVSFKIF